jgi:hypothetical protein
MTRLLRGGAILPMTAAQKERAAEWPPFELFITGSPAETPGDDAQRYFDDPTPMPFSLSFA